MSEIKSYVDRDLIELTLKEGEVVLGFYDLESKHTENGMQIFRDDLYVFREYRGKGYKYMLIERAVKELEELARLHGPLRHVVVFASDESEQRLRPVFERHHYRPLEGEKNVLFRDYNSLPLRK